MISGFHIDRRAAWSSHLLATLILLLLASLIIGVLVQGSAVLGVDFMLEMPGRAGLAGGIASVMVSTLLLLLITLGVVIPVGLGAALFLVDAGKSSGFLHRLTGYVLDVLAAVPSIVFALFGYQFFSRTLGLGFSLLSGGLTLACMALPLMVRTSEQTLHLVSAHWRSAGEALALSRWGMLRKVVLPAAAPGLAAAITLSTGRALAETAVLLFTAGYVLRMPTSLLDSGRALSVHIYDLAMNLPGGQARAAASAAVLMAVIVLVNLITRRLLKVHGNQ
jgi:phosphate transport system permease protein